LPPDTITEIINTLSELKRMHQLNLELLEQLGVACSWLMEHNIPIPNASTLSSLLSKTMVVLAEIYSDMPKVLQYSAIRRKVTDQKSDGEVTEPDTATHIRFERNVYIG